MTIWEKLSKKWRIGKLDNIDGEKLENELSIQLDGVMEVIKKENLVPSAIEVILDDGDDEDDW